MARPEAPLFLCAPLLLSLGLAAAACSGPDGSRKEPSVAVGESASQESASQESPPKEPRGPLPQSLRDQPNGFEPVALADSPNMPPTCSKCPSGMCTTSQQSWCGGVHPPEGWEKQRAREVKWWICEPVPPGCPARRPENDTACSEEGKRCAYGSCHFELSLCEGGKWKSAEVHPP